MTVVSVWERKKEKKKWVKEACRTMAAAISVTGNRAVVSDDDDDNDDVDNE